MRIRDLGSAVNVNVSRAEVAAFNRAWPASSMPTRAVCFQFDKRNGDLIDLWGPKNDGPALLALSHDASNYAAKRLSLPQLER